MTADMIGVTTTCGSAVASHEVAELARQIALASAALVRDGLFVPADQRATAIALGVDWLEAAVARGLPAAGLCETLASVALAAVREAVA